MRTTIARLRGATLVAVGGLCLSLTLGATSVSRAQASGSAASAAAALDTGAPSWTAPQGIVVPALGVDTLLDKRAAAVSSRLRCPVCQGESIQDSPAELSSQMRTLVREQLVAGRTDAQIYEYFVQKYGQWILLEPKAEGINLLVYWLPVFFLVAGAAGIWIVVKKWTRPQLSSQHNAEIVNDSLTE